AGEALVTDARVPMIAFTGSPGVGRRIGELAGRHLKKVSLELGGANSLIILDDADLDLAASNAAWGAWLHQGQICMAANRILVHEAIYGAIKERLVGKATHMPVGNGARSEEHTSELQSPYTTLFRSKVSLELGGANSLIILDDADLDLAASNAAWGAWLHQGQICMAANRILVHEAIYGAIKERLVGKATHMPVGNGA